MTLSLNPVSLVNVVLCAIILMVGYLCYNKNKNKEVLYIGIAFGIFGISHVLTLLGLVRSLESVLISIRMLAYLMVVFSLYTTATRP